eukprot:8910553-Karenia_brevis.AAC.1
MSWTALNANTCALSLATEMHKHTWSSTEGLPGVVRTLRGTGAGLPLADVVYVVALAKVLRSLRSRLSAEGLIDTFQSNDGLNPLVEANGYCDELLHDASYVDDTVVPIFGPPSEMLERIRRATGICVHVFIRYGMELNFKPGKSEVMIKWVGKHSQAQERKLTITMNNIITCPTFNGSFVDLRAVSMYRHMGSRTAVGSQMSQEVSFRMTAMRAESMKLRKCILRNPGLSNEHKLNCMQAYMVTKGFFHAGTWPHLPARLYIKVHHQVLAIYREILGNTFAKTDKLFTDDEVVAQLGAMSPLTMIRMSRLLLFSR